ncbi:MAG TPA: type IV secretion system protein, partial [Candidatus Eisenbacteria bacterium]|nr:type IV secretion system protein [Candidatus Eisenbacteria bacterium]
LTLAILLLAIWLVWQLLARGRTMQGLAGAGWALVAIVLAGLYFGAPLQVLSGVNAFTMIVSRAVLASIGTGDPAMGSRAGDPSFSQGDASDAEIRMFADRYWRTFVFTPWSVAALGDPQTGQRYGEELLAKQAGQPSNFEADFQGASPQARIWYSGRFGGSRFWIALVALIVVLLNSVLYLVIAGAVVVTQLALVILLMLAPLFLLVGVQPGTGRRMLVRWAELAVGTLLVRVLSAAFVAVLLVLSGIVDEVGSASWLVSSGLQLALVVAAFVYRRPFLRIFGQVAVPRVVSSHAGHRRTAQTAHRGMDWLARRVAGRPGEGGGAARVVRGRAAVAAPRPTVAQVAGGAGMALLALEAGKVGLRAAARANRALQNLSTSFVLDGPRTAPRPIFFGTAARSLPAPRVSPTPGGPPASGSPPAPSRPPTSAVGRPPRPAAGRSYRHARTGETFTIGSSKIVLPGARQGARRRERPVSRRTYLNVRTGETVRVSSRIVLPGHWSPAVRTVSSGRIVLPGAWRESRP